jgi:hypothetical protein
MQGWGGGATNLGMHVRHSKRPTAAGQVGRHCCSGLRATHGAQVVQPSKAATCRWPCLCAGVQPDCRPVRDGWAICSLCPGARWRICHACRPMQHPHARCSMCFLFHAGESRAQDGRECVSQHDKAPRCNQSHRELAHRAPLVFRESTARALPGLKCRRASKPPKSNLAIPLPTNVLRRNSLALPGRGVPAAMAAPRPTPTPAQRQCAVAGNHKR